MTSDQTPASSPPPPKYARPEHSHPLDSSKQEIGSPSYPTLTQEQVDGFIAVVRHGFKLGLVDLYYGVLIGLNQINEDMPSNLVSQEDFLTNLRIHEDFSPLLMKACGEEATTEDKQAVVTHRALWTVPPPKPQRSAVENISVEAQEMAVVNSWSADFIDDGPLGGLERHISKQLVPKSVGKIYARYCSIVQSSGMGKSRLLDEFARGHFVIPINLRPAMSDGFPPADGEVRDFLLSVTDALEVSADSAYSRACNLFLALFNKTEETIASFNGRTKAERIKEFRTFMSDGQSMRVAGGNRQRFYSDVVTRARDAQATGSDPSSDGLTKALDRLRSTLSAGSDQMTCTIRAKDANIFVDIFIAFDEAHSLTTPFHEEDMRSNFTELRRALRELLNSPLWSFFLSTTSEITHPSLPCGFDPSSRIIRSTLITPSPYIHLGFDQLMRSRKLSERSTLDYITSVECIVHMGRPLWGTHYDHGNEEVRNGILEFAIHKLLGKLENGKALSNAQMYAVLSQRLALDIDTPQYLLTPASPSTLMQTMHEQIANHMRICLAVGSGVESLRGIASSEPILSEAACRIMNNEGLDFKLPIALSNVLSGFCINQSTCGELLVATFFIWARDQVVLTKLGPSSTLLSHHFTVCDLFKSLFCGPSLEAILQSKPSLYPKNNTLYPFEQVFGNARMHFNHFVKPYELMTITCQFLIRFLARGAAALGANCEPSFGAVYPYLYEALNLDVKKLGFIIVQVKNHSNVSRNDIPEVFQKMDPFGCGLLSKSKDKSKKQSPFTIPIIRILFLLSGTLDNVEPWVYSPPSDGATTLDEPLFTSYDFVCSGVSPAMLRPITTHPESWKALVNKRSDWVDFIESSEEKEILCSELPGSGSDAAHFSGWSGDNM